jgi:hypothetical protein
MYVQTGRISRRALLQRAENILQVLHQLKINTWNYDPEVREKSFELFLFVSASYYYDTQLYRYGKRITLRNT